jgi:hypothetical protein
VTRQEARSAAPRRLRECVERWPECESGAYDPRCCRFPKSCSCTSYPSTWTETDLEPRPESSAATPSPRSLFRRVLPRAHGLRVAPDRVQLFSSCSPVVIDFGYLRWNGHWWKNLGATHWWIFWLQHREKPTYWYWDHNLPVPCDGSPFCNARDHKEGCRLAR